MTDAVIAGNHRFCFRKIILDALDHDAGLLIDCVAKQMVTTKKRGNCMKTGRTMKSGFAVFLAAFLCVCAVFCASADDTCIVSGSVARDAAESVPSTLAAPSWFDSSSFVEFITVPLSVFDSFPLGLRLIFR